MLLMRGDVNDINNTLLNELKPTLLIDDLAVTPLSNIKHGQLYSATVLNCALPDRHITH